MDLILEPVAKGEEFSASIVDAKVGVCLLVAVQSMGEKKKCVTVCRIIGKFSSGTCCKGEGFE